MQERTPKEIANRGYSLILKRLASVKAGDVADEMGISQSALSELKNKAAENLLLLAAKLGLKLVPTDYVTVKPVFWEFMNELHSTVMDRAPHLIHDGDDFPVSGFDAGDGAGRP